MAAYGMLRSYSRDPQLTRKSLTKGTARRIMRYAGPYKRQIAVFLATTVAAAARAAALPLLLQFVIDSGVPPGRPALVVRGAVALAPLARLHAGLGPRGRAGPAGEPAARPEGRARAVA